MSDQPAVDWPLCPECDSEISEFVPDRFRHGDLSNMQCAYCGTTVCIECHVRREFECWRVYYDDEDRVFVQ